MQLILSTLYVVVIFILIRIATQLFINLNLVNIRNFISDKNFDINCIKRMILLKYLKILATYKIEEFCLDLQNDCVVTILQLSSNFFLKLIDR